MWDIETTRIALQTGTLIAVVVGLGLTIRQLRLTTDQIERLRVNNADLHDWNRRKAAQEAIDSMVPRIVDSTPILDEKFHILTTRDTIPVEAIEKACKKDKRVRLAIHKRLNYFESLASGVQQGVLDEEVIKNYYQFNIGNTLIQFRDYIESYRREQGSWEIFSDLEGMDKRWNELDRQKSARLQTGHDPTTIRARESKGG